MNIEYANTIPMRIVFDKLLLQPVQEEGRFLLYVSPFGNSKLPTLKLNLHTNRWTDTQSGLSGSVIDFLCQYFEYMGRPAHVKDILNWLRGNLGYVVLNCPEQTPIFLSQDRKYAYRDHGLISTPALISYMEQDRGIPIDYVRFLLREVRICNTETGKTFFALGMANDEGGIAIRNPCIKANVRPLYTTFIRGRQIKTDGIHIFKDFFDYLSILTRRHGRPFEDDVIILNHLSMMKLSSAFIRGYGYKQAYTWLDNTALGKEATRLYGAFFRTDPGLIHHPMNHLYRPHKDVNEWHVSDRR